MAGISRGDVWLDSLDPIIGSEIGKTRPAIVISNDINNKYSKTVTLISITSSTSKIYPFEVLLPKGSGKLAKDSKAKCNQVRTVDKRRLVKKTGNLPKSLIKELENAIIIHLGIPV
ncbi:MAG: type II toxin-antitoxin system PemK/MazF family toxin [Candidatus Dadabacteria bacterium]|nr:type II toxin-antitoxin system PemK/MazF family toxin [Candidatus Dadabacteria bacterium]NIS09200.1 type II toxin-antitoxin system PemK/MazF family toxin [Candidatus Dadabacteria bacterium]NIV41816.1 type II toxin-antitoxin system PemK/MazF family toxin [Candidatus Dadabacteria bacterium]NIX15759.1 type II toxin-antitoxin system PemK/MazF family toxin [Candidatus Dadabacteria bacterium]NIY22631.1 type II toxin-antitoxin system PemK/MazF family toxin [Candidatus Dadabacteria bacterium]